MDVLINDPVVTIEAAVDCVGNLVMIVTGEVSVDAAGSLAIDTGQ